MGGDECSCHLSLYSMFSLIPLREKITLTFFNFPPCACKNLAYALKVNDKVGALKRIRGFPNAAANTVLFVCFIQTCMWRVALHMSAMVALCGVVVGLILVVKSECCVQQDYSTQ